MVERTQIPTTQESGSQPNGLPNQGRRRLLRRGAAAAPVLLTLVSRPALGWGQADECFTPSGFVSMPTSQHGKPYYCSGRTPGYWKVPQHFSSWVGFYPTTVTGMGGHQASKFKDVFTPTPYPPQTTLLQVLWLEGGPPNDVARHIVAALLNVMAGWTPVLTVPVVKGIWSEYMNTGGGTGGYFEPTAGVKWYHDDIVNYLLSTMPI